MSNELMLMGVATLILLNFQKDIAAICGAQLHSPALTPAGWHPSPQRPGSVLAVPSNSYLGSTWLDNVRGCSCCLSSTTGVTGCYLAAKGCASAQTLADCCDQPDDTAHLPKVGPAAAGQRPGRRLSQAAWKSPTAGRQHTGVFRDGPGMQVCASVFNDSYAPYDSPGAFYTYKERARAAVLPAAQAPGQPGLASAEESPPDPSSLASATTSAQPGQLLGAQQQQQQPASPPTVQAQSEAGPEPPPAAASSDDAPQAAASSSNPEPLAGGEVTPAGGDMPEQTHSQRRRLLRSCDCEGPPPAVLQPCRRLPLLWAAGHRKGRPALPGLNCV